MRKMKKSNRISKTLKNQLEKYRDRITDLPYSAERSRLVDCATYMVEEGGINETRHLK